MSIVLVNPNYSDDSYFVSLPKLPVGLGFIAQALYEQGIDYKVFDLNVHGADDLLKYVETNEVEFVGFGLMSFHVERQYALINEVKEVSPRTKVIIGGPHSIAAGEQVLVECSGVDILVLGEGERTIVEIATHQNLGSIENIIFREGVDIVATQRSRVQLDINSVAFPRYHGFSLEHYDLSMIPLASSRGCVYHCTFCGAPTFLGKKHRPRSAAKMIEEFEFWYEQGHRRFLFSDSLFAINKKRIIAFCEYIVGQGYDTEFCADGVRADNLNLEVLTAMKQANFTEITIGVESASNRILEFYKKKEKIEQIQTAILLCRKLQMVTNLFFILGAPIETISDMRKSIRFSRRFTNVKSVFFFHLTPIIGTPYYEYVKEHQLFPLPETYPNGKFGLVFNEDFVPPSIDKNAFRTLFQKAQKTSRYIYNRFQFSQQLSSRSIHITYAPIVDILFGLYAVWTKRNKLKNKLKGLKYIKKMSYSRFAEIHSKRLVGWGSGEWFLRSQKAYEFRLDYVIDKNPAKVGKRFQGYDIKSLDSLLEESKDEIFVIVFTQSSYIAVYEWLAAHGFEYLSHFSFFSVEMLESFSSRYLKDSA